ERPGHRGTRVARRARRDAPAPRRRPGAGRGGLTMCARMRLTPPRRRAAWQLYLAAGALLCALYVWVPPFAGSGPVMNVLGLSPVVAIVAVLRLHLPQATRAWRVVR